MIFAIETMVNTKQGVVILCMRKQQYAAAAYNLALTIKFHSPGINITLLSDGIHNKLFSTGHYGAFNFIKEIKEKTVAEAKLNIENYVEYDQALYIDADSICLQPLEPLFDKLKGNKFKSNVIDNYTNWVSPEYFKQMFDVEPNQTINSSWIYFEDKRVFKIADKYLKKGFDVSNLVQTWGNSSHVPDELFFNGALAKLVMDAKVDFNVMFFDDKIDQRSTSKLAEDYYFLTYYGNKNNTRLEIQEWYDREMFRVCAKYGIEHRFKIHEIMAHKLVNEK